MSDCQMDCNECPTTLRLTIETVNPAGEVVLSNVFEARNLTRQGAEVSMMADIQKLADVWGKAIADHCGDPVGMAQSI